MKTSRTIIVFLAMAIVVVSVLPCAAVEKKQEDEKSIWVEEGPRGHRGPRELRGPRRGPGREKSFELTDDEIGRIMNSLKESDPAKAKDLEKLRSEDPNRFRLELRRHGGEEFGRIVRQRIERWRNQRRDEFLQWLEKNYHNEAEGLAKLKDKDPELYNKKFDLLLRKYGPIQDEEKRSPELAEVLKEDLELRRICDELIGKIKSSKDEKEKKGLVEDLEVVVGRRYYLIIKRKQIEYERLLKRVEELQKHLKQSKAEIDEWRNENSKNENVKNRVNELLGEHSFKWD